MNTAKPVLARSITKSVSINRNPDPVFCISLRFGELPAMGRHQYQAGDEQCGPE
jgi:hypothetical protein